MNNTLNIFSLKQIYKLLGNFYLQLGEEFSLRPCLCESPDSRVDFGMKSGKRTIEDYQSSSTWFRIGYPEQRELQTGWRLMEFRLLIFTDQIPKFSF